MGLTAKIYLQLHIKQAATDGYKVIVKAPSYWWIYKWNDLVDCCFYHPNIANSELQAKVQAERAMNSILNKTLKT